MSLKKSSANLRDESFLTDKIRAKIITRATNSNTSLKNVFKTDTRINHHHTIITTKSL